MSRKPFPGVLLGLSGGIDSAICAAIAVDALGRSVCIASCCRRAIPANQALLMRPLAKALGIKLDDVSIAEPVDAVESVLGDLFKGTNADLTEENIQSRCAARC